MKKKTAYVAGSSKELVAVRHVQQLLRDAGFEISLDWTKDVEANAGIPDRDLPPKKARVYAEADLDAIMHSNLFVLVAPAGPSSFGAGVELGYALGDCHTAVIGTEAKSHIFMHCADRIFCEPLNDAVKHMIKWFEKGCPE